MKKAKIAIDGLIVILHIFLLVVLIKEKRE